MEGATGIVISGAKVKSFCGNLAAPSVQAADGENVRDMPATVPSEKREPKICLLFVGSGRQNQTEGSSFKVFQPVPCGEYPKLRPFGRLCFWLSL
jgi:hypothetical protein